MKLTVQYDLTLGDVTGQVRDRVRDIIVWHGQDRNLCYGSLYTLYDSGALIQRSQLTVQVSRITFTGRNLSTGGGNLTHSLAEGCDIGQDNQDMHAFLECKVLGSCQRYLRSDQTLYNRVVCQVQEHNNVVRYTAFLKGPAEELCYVVFNTHSGKYDCKLLIRISKGCLLYDLCCQLVVRKSVSGEDWQLLATNQGSQTVDCRNTGMDIVSWVFTGNRVQRQAVDVSSYLCVNWSHAVDRFSDTVEGTSKDFFGKSDLHRMSGQTGMGIGKRHARSSLKYLNNGFVFVYSNDTSQFFLIAVYGKFYDFLVGSIFYTFQNNQRAIDLTKA